MGGQALSKIRGSLITRPMQRFNIEARTDKILKKEKNLSPKYPSDKELLESIRQDRPEVVDAATKKDTELLSKLQNIYVASSDPEDFDPDVNRKVPENPERPLPGKLVRGSPTAGFVEAGQIMAATKYKKLGLDEIQLLLNQFPHTVSANSSVILRDMSEKYGLSVEQLANLHKYYRVFQLKQKSLEEEEVEEHDPYAAQDSWQVDEPARVQKQVYSTSIKHLPPASTNR